MFMKIYHIFNLLQLSSMERERERERGREREREGGCVEREITREKAETHREKSQRQ